MSARPPYPVRKAARRALEMGCEQLNLIGDFLGKPTVAIEWCSREEIGGNTGETRGFELYKIWVATDMDVEQTVCTIFHELRHVGRLRANKIPQVRLSRQDREEEEAIADGFEAWMWRRFFDEHSNKDWFPDETDDPTF